MNVVGNVPLNLFITMLILENAPNAAVSLDRSSSGKIPFHIG